MMGMAKCALHDDRLRLFPASGSERCSNRATRSFVSTLRGDPAQVKGFAARLLTCRRRRLNGVSCTLFHASKIHDLHGEVFGKARRLERGALGMEIHQVKPNKAQQAKADVK